MDILITLMAATLIFLSGVGIGAAITDRIMSKEEENGQTETSTAETIRGQADTQRS